MPRSGSTLTDLMLHQLPDHIGIGELFYLWRNGLAHDGLCACSASFSECPFWSEVGRVAFGGWDRTDPDHVMRLQEQVDRTSRLPLLISPIRPRRFAAQLEEYSEILRRLYSGIVTVSGQSVVVDSSKRPSLAYILRTMPDVDLSVVHVVRDPRGRRLLVRQARRVADGAALRSEMPRSTTRKVSRRWVIGEPPHRRTAPARCAGHAGALRGPGGGARSGSCARCSSSRTADTSEEVLGYVTDDGRHRSPDPRGGRRPDPVGQRHDAVAARRAVATRHARPVPASRRS